MKKTLTTEQCKKLLAVVSMQNRPQDKAMIIALLLSGSDSRTWTWDAAARDFMMPFAVYHALRDLAAAKRMTVFPFHHVQFSAHWVQGGGLNRAIFAGSGRATALTTQDITRRLKRYARLAGINVGDMSLRTVANTHHALISRYGTADNAADAIGIQTTTHLSLKQALSQNNTNRPALERNARLHGIGRRSLMKSA